MNHFLKTFCLCTAALILFSCSLKRDDDGDLLFGVNPPVDGGQTITKRLTKVTAVDGSGDQIIYTYIYTNGKLSALQMEEDGAITKVDVAYTNGLMSALSSKKTEGSEVSTTNVDLGYVSGRLVSANGTFKENADPEKKYETEFSYNSAGKANRMQTKISIKDPANSTQWLLDQSIESTLTYTVNNIAVWDLVENAYPLHNNVPTQVMKFKTSFSDYDANHNPFALLPQAFNLAMAHQTISANAVVGLSTNNYKKVSITSGGSTHTTSYTYTYDAEGLPLTATSTDGNIKYEYK